jgi:VanZ family protein
MKPNIAANQKLRIIFLIASIAWAAAIFCFSAIPASGLPENLGLWSIVGHFSEYMLLAVLLTLAINHPSHKLCIQAVIVVAIASLYGASDEFHQLFVDGRRTDVFDWMADTAGALIGTAGASIIICVRRKRKKISGE